MGVLFLTSQKADIHDVVFTSIRAAALAGVSCLFLLLLVAGLIRTGIGEEKSVPLLIAGCALISGALSGILMRIGKRGKAVTALLSTAMVTLFLLILSAGIRKTGQLPFLGILPFSGAFASGFAISCIMQNNKKDRRRKK